MGGMAGLFTVERPVDADLVAASQVAATGAAEATSHGAISSLDATSPWRTPA